MSAPEKNAAGTELDERVIEALTYYRMLIEKSGHNPSPEARRALLGVKQSIEDNDRRRHAGIEGGVAWD